MKIMKTLSLGVLQSNVSNPVAERRAKLIAGLQEQKLLAADPKYTRTEYKWKVDEHGVKQRLEAQKRVRSWWRLDESGRVMLALRYGAKAIEIEKGKTAVLLPSQDQLASTIDRIIEAIRAGELDEQLANLAKARVGIRKKKAA